MSLSSPDAECGKYQIKIISNCQAGGDITKLFLRLFSYLFTTAKLLCGIMEPNANA